MRDARLASDVLADGIVAAEVLVVRYKELEKEAAAARARACHPGSARPPAAGEGGAGLHARRGSVVGGGGEGDAVKKFNDGFTARIKS